MVCEMAAILSIGIWFKTVNGTELMDDRKGINYLINAY